MNERLGTTTNTAKTQPTVDTEMASPRAYLAFGALKVARRVSTSLRELLKIWNERHSLGADDGRFARTCAPQRGLGNTSRSDINHGAAIQPKENTKFVPSEAQYPKG